MIYRFLANFPFLAAAPAQVAQHGRKPPADLSDAQVRFTAQAADLFKNFDWKWFLYFTVAAFIIFGILFFATQLFKRWQSPRLGFFMYTAAMFMIRSMRPEDKAWIAFSLVGAGLSVFLILYVLTVAKNVNKKEPIYYILNTFTLLIISTPPVYYFYAVAGMSLFASLFFITTKNPTSPNKYKKRDADPYILEALEKRAGKKL